jgi:spore coat protein U-like protein
MRLSQRASLLLATATLLLGAASAHAGTDSDTMTVTATVIASCDITTNPMAFGNYNPVSGTPLDAATTLGVHCTNGTAYEIAMNAGAGAGATIPSRRMTNGSDTLTYSIYRDSNRSNVWGQTSGSNVLTGTGTGASQTLNVYGRVPINQTSPAAAYTDTITVTLTY